MKNERFPLDALLHDIIALFVPNPAHQNEIKQEYEQLAIQQCLIILMQKATEEQNPVKDALLALQKDPPAYTDMTGKLISLIPEETLAQVMLESRLTIFTDMLETFLKNSTPEQKAQIAALLQKNDFLKSLLEEQKK